MSLTLRRHNSTDYERNRAVNLNSAIRAINTAEPEPKSAFKPDLPKIRLRLAHVFLCKYTKVQGFFETKDYGLNPQKQLGKVMMENIKQLKLSSFIQLLIRILSQSSGFPNPHRLQNF